MLKNYTNSNTKLKNKTESSFYNIKKILYGPDGKPCDFIIGEKIGEPSTYGTVFDACCIGSNSQNSSKCHYVLKKLNTLDERQLIKETTIQMKANKSNLAPKVILSYVTDKECGFIMEKLKPISSLFYETIENEKLLRDFIGDILTIDEQVFDYVVGERVIILKRDNPQFMDLRNEFEKILNKKRELLKQIILEIKQLHFIGIAHEDTHLDNIAVDNDNKIKFIDFGLSLDYNYEIDSEDDYDILKRSLKNKIGKIRKIKDSYKENSIEYLKHLIIEYHFSYLEEEFDELI